MHPKNDSLTYSSSRIPTKYGFVNVYCFLQDQQETIAIVYGSIDNSTNVLTRIHSECFTGDVIHSLKCDCGEQLDTALKKITAEGSGIVIYLKQEGRGIGLFNKLKAYNLQETLNLDTIDSNLELGFETDYRTYDHAIAILNFFKIKSIRLITNNPDKIDAFKNSDIQVTQKISLASSEHKYNSQYLSTKINKLNHSIAIHHKSKKNISVTVAYAQSLNGSISLNDLSPVCLSNKDSLQLTHQLRSQHDAILIGVNTLNHDNPQLTVRYNSGPQPQPCIIDTNLNFLHNLTIFDHPKKPWFFTASNDQSKISQLEDLGAKVIHIKTNSSHLIDLPSVLKYLENQGFSSILVEGGKRILTRFLDEQLVDCCVITLAPLFFHGTNVLDSSDKFKLNQSIKLSQLSSYTLADNIIVEGVPEYV